MGSFFSKDNFEKLKQQAKDIKSSYDVLKERQEYLKVLRQEQKNYNAEKKAKFSGTLLRSISVIPQGSEVTIGLDPESQFLFVSYTKDISLRLPYSRVMGFRLENIVEEGQNIKADIAGTALSSGILGRGMVGTVGKIAGGMMMGLKKRQAFWIGTLLYRDKEGGIQEISVARPKQELEHNEIPTKSAADEQFEHIVNRIALNANQEILEL